MKAKINYIFIPNLLCKIKIFNYLDFYKYIIQLIILIFTHQDIDGSVTIIIPFIINKITINLFYILSLYYQKISFSTKIIDILTSNNYNELIINCKLFRGININIINKLQKLINKFDNKYNNITNIFKWKNKISELFIQKIDKINKFYKIKKKKNR